VEKTLADPIRQSFLSRVRKNEEERRSKKPEAFAATIPLDSMKTIPDAVPPTMEGRKSTSAAKQEPSASPGSLSTIQTELYGQELAAIETASGEESDRGFVPRVLPEDFIKNGILRQVNRNEFVFKEREESSELFLVAKGRLEVTKKIQNLRRVLIANLDPGDCFGEQALLGDGFRHCTIKAIEPSEVRVFSKRHIVELMAKSSKVDRDLRRLYRDRLQEALLKTSSVFSKIPADDARAFLRQCKPLRLRAGERVVREDTPATGFYIVLLGQLEVTRKHGAEWVKLARLTDGDFFGEISLIYDQLTAATVQTVSFCQLLQISAGEFHRFVSTHTELLKVLEIEAKERERTNRAILHGTAHFDEKKGIVVYLKKGT
jgi:CRP-like cAMP-binding protein